MDDRTIARFWSKVDKSAGHEGCWLWKAGKFTDGYRSFCAGGRRGKALKAHRVAWELTNGTIPPGEGSHGTCVCHRCDVRQCVNPAHMFIGTQADNVEDCRVKGRTADLRGERSGMAKLTWPIVAQMRIDRAGGETYASLGLRYGVSSVQARNVVVGKCWRDTVRRSAWAGKGGE